MAGAAADQCSLSPQYFFACLLSLLSPSIFGSLGLSRVQSRTEQREYYWAPIRLPLVREKEGKGKAAAAAAAAVIVRSRSSLLEGRTAAAALNDTSAI